MVDTRTPEVKAISLIAFTGNIIPHHWWQSIRTPAGKPDWLGIVILAEVCYWYRERVERDEATGAVIGRHKKFKADFLQKNYAALAEQFGTTIKHAKAAVQRLEKAGLLKRLCKTVDVGGRRIPNVLYIKPLAEAVGAISPSAEGDTTLGKGQYHTPPRVTYTESTTESTTETTVKTPETGASALVPSRKKRSEPSPEARELTNLFAQAYLRHTGNRYATSEADSKSSMVLLASTGLQCSAIISIVEKLWASKGWWGKRVVTLKALRDHWNEVQTEVSLGPVSNVPPHVEAKKLRAMIERHPANPCVDRSQIRDGDGGTESGTSWLGGTAGGFGGDGGMSRVVPPDRLPPHSGDAERGVLGCILLSPRVGVDNALDALQGFDTPFYDPRHGLIYGVIKEMLDQNHAVDMVTLVSKLESSGDLAKIGGFEYLASLMDAVPSRGEPP